MKGYQKFGDNKKFKTNRGTQFEFCCFVPNESPKNIVNDISKALIHLEIINKKILK